MSREEKRNLKKRRKEQAKLNHLFDPFSIHNILSLDKREEILSRKKKRNEKKVEPIFHSLHLSFGKTGQN